jgi:hypothetical protein
MDVSGDEIISEGASSDGEMDATLLDPTTPNFESLDRWQANIDLKTLADRLTTAARAVFPSKSRSRYSRVQVLMLEWEGQESDLQGSSEVFNLFKSTFYFDTERWQIPSQDSQAAVSKTLNAFLQSSHESNDNECLKILYYSGYSRQLKADNLILTKFASSTKIHTRNPLMPRTDL